MIKVVKLIKSDRLGEAKAPVGPASEDQILSEYSKYGFEFKDGSVLLKGKKIGTYQDGEFRHDKYFLPTDIAINNDFKVVTMKVANKLKTRIILPNLIKNK